MLKIDEKHKLNASPVLVALQDGLERLLRLSKVMNLVLL
jgi:hypothetical protein